MRLAIKLKKPNISLYTMSIYLCVLFACLVPRYIHTFKIHVGMAFSIYTIMVVAVWFIFSRRIIFSKDIGACFFGIMLLLTIFNLWRVENWGQWAHYFVWIMTALLFMQIVSLKPSYVTFETIVSAIAHALLIQLLIGMYEVFSHQYVFEIGNLRGRLYGNVAISMFYNQNDYATFVTTFLPFAIYRFFNQKTFAAIVTSLFLVIASIYLTILSESRAAYLGLIMLFGSIVFLYCKKCCNESNSRKIRVIGIGLLVMTIACYSFMFHGFVASVAEAAEEINDKSAWSNMLRINLLKNGLHFLEMTYGLGVGAGNLSYYLQHYSIYNIWKLAMMHNWYMEILATFGIPFFLLYLIFHIKIIMKLLKSCDKIKTFWNLNTTLLMTFLIFSIVSISSSSNIYSEWVWMYLTVVSTYVRFRCE